MDELRRFCLNTNVGWDICLFWVGLGYDELLRSFMYAAPTLWNVLNLDIRLLPFDAFKKKSQDTSLFKVLCKLILMIYILFV